MYNDVYQMYLEELESVTACTPQEEAQLLLKVRMGDPAAKKRLLEGTLSYTTDLAKNYADRGLPLGDLVQEANLALLTAVDLVAEGRDQGDFRALVKSQVEASIEAALGEQNQANQAEEELLARVNVLQEVSRRMAEELGREANLAELAGKMKMTEAEIRDIMKLTLDAISVSPDLEE